MSKYIEKFKNLTSTSVIIDNIISIASSCVPIQYKTCPWVPTDHGRKVLKEEWELDCYMAAYGEMHKHKLFDALEHFPFSELDEDFKHTLVDFIKEQSNLTTVIRKFALGNDITASGVIKFSASLGSGAFNFLIGIILAFYFLIGKKKLVEILSEFFFLVIPSKHYDNCKNVWMRFNSIFSRFIVCELVDALIVGAVNCLFMFSMHMPYAVFCSVVVALTNLAPTFGPFVGAFICAVILLLAQPESVIPFLIFTLALQLIDGYVIKPRLFGSALKVPAFLVLVFLVVGGKLWGVPGVLLAIPLAAILSYIYREIAVPWLAQRKKVKDEEEAKEKTKKNKFKSEDKEVVKNDPS